MELEIFLAWMEALLKAQLENVVANANQVIQAKIVKQQVNVN